MSLIVFVHTVFLGFMVRDLDVSSEEDAVKRLIAVWESCNGGYGDFPDVSVDIQTNDFSFRCHRAIDNEEYVYNKGGLTGTIFDFKQRGNTEYLLDYLKQNAPTYDCGLVDSNYGFNRPCWRLSQSIQINTERNR